MFSACFTTMEVVAVEEVKRMVLEELVTICKDQIVPEIIHQLQFTEMQLDNLAKDENKI